MDRGALQATLEMIAQSRTQLKQLGTAENRGAKILHASGPKNQSIKQKQYCSKFNKAVKNGPQKFFKKLIKAHCHGKGP